MNEFLHGPFSERSRVLFWHDWSGLSRRSLGPRFSVWNWEGLNRTKGTYSNVFTTYNAR